MEKRKNLKHEKTHKSEIDKNKREKFNLRYSKSE